jgi:DNA helicase MCM8
MSPAGKLATLRGTVTRMSHVRPLIVEMTFTCNKCGSSISTAMPDGRFTPPTRCSGKRAAAGLQQLTF